jgi:uncharacterized membrane protein
MSALLKAPPPEPSRRRWARWLLAAFFLGLGTFHFTHTEAYLPVMPPVFPAPRTLILWSGFFEILGALGLLVPDRRARRTAGWGLAALLVAVFPANIYMATQGLVLTGLVGRMLLWLRLPFQPLLIAWALWASGAVRRASQG